MRQTTILIGAVIIGGAAVAFSQTMEGDAGHRMKHAAHVASGSNAGAVLSEPGQGAFAALSEVVRVLEADPDTDWSEIDLAGLRAHLVDMDRLVSDTVVTETELANGLSVRASGDAKTVATLRRMVPAHAAQLARDDRWTVVAEEFHDGMELRVTSADPETVARIKGLGFFGLMASQDHHREHHLMMARGQNVHRH